MFVELTDLSVFSVGNTLAILFEGLPNNEGILNPDAVETLCVPEEKLFNFCIEFLCSLAKNEIDGTKSSNLIPCTQRHDPKGYAKVKKYVYQLMDENPSRRGIENAFRQRYPQVAKKYVKSSLKNTLYRFKKEYKEDNVQDFECTTAVKSARGVSNSARRKPKWDNLDKF